MGEVEMGPVITGWPALPSGPFGAAGPESGLGAGSVAPRSGATGPVPAKTPPAAGSGGRCGGEPGNGDNGIAPFWIDGASGGGTGPEPTKTPPAAGGGGRCGGEPGNGDTGTAPFWIDGASGGGTRPG